MVEAVRLGKEELKQRFRCSERLAIRVGALASKGLGVTAGVLEEAVRLPEIETILLSPEILAKAGVFDSASLRAQFPKASELAIVDRVLALDEEVQAEKSWSQPSTLPAAAPTSLPAFSGGGGLDLRDVHSVFSPDEIGRIKMTLLTSVEPGARIEALKKLALAPMGAEDKGLLAIRALTDSVPDVRREAATVLESMGLNRELADAIKSAASGTPRQREMAVQRIAVLGPRATPSERTVAVAFLVGGLAHEREALVLKALLSSLTAFSDLLAGHADLLASLTRNLIKTLADFYDEVASPSRSLLDSIGARKNPEGARTIWKESEGAGDRRMQILFLEALFAMALPADLEQELCRKAVDELSGKPMEDLESRRLADALRMRGDTALETLLKLVESANEDGRAMLVAVLDTVASGDGIRSELRDRTGEFMLTILRDGSRPVRTAIIEARLCWHAGLSASIKKRLASDFILNLHAYKASRIQDLTIGAIRRIGLDAVDALKNCIEKSAYPVERETAGALLAEIADECGGTSEQVADIVSFLRSQETGDRLPIGAAIRDIGRAAHGPGTPRDILGALLKDFTSRLGKVPYNYDLIAALGWIASSEACDAGAASDMALRYVDMLESPMPELEVNETRTEEGTHLFVGAQTTVYTDLLPEVIGGLGKICRAGRLHDNTRTRILERLAAKYALLVSYQEIWAPGNIVEFGEMMGSVAKADFVTGPERCRVITSMMGNLRNLATVRILAGVFIRNDDDDAEYSSLLGRFIDQVLYMIGRPEYQDRDDQKLLIESLGRVAGNRRLGDADRKSPERRERIVELLIENSDWIREAKPMLRTLAVSAHVPEALKSRAAGGSA